MGADGVFLWIHGVRASGRAGPPRRPRRRTKRTDRPHPEGAFVILGVLRGGLSFDSGSVADLLRSVRCPTARRPAGRKSCIWWWTDPLASPRLDVALPACFPGRSEAELRGPAPPASQSARTEERRVGKKGVV